MEDTISGLIKIGKSVNVEYRLKQHQTSNPYCKLLFYTDKFSESHFHQKFKNDRVIGEWFNLSRLQLKQILNTKINVVLVDFNVKEYIEIDGYYFIGIEGLYFHSDKFWFNEEEVKQVYNNGSLSILLYGTSKKSIKKLRKQARRCRIKLFTEPLPF